VDSVVMQRPFRPSILLHGPEEPSSESLKTDWKWKANGNQKNQQSECTHSD